MFNLIIGICAGVLGTALFILLVLAGMEAAHANKVKKAKDKEFVLNLIEKEGMGGAYNIITFNFCGKRQYMKVWKEEYKKYINTKGENNNEQ